MLIQNAIKNVPRKQVREFFLWSRNVNKFLSPILTEKLVFCNRIYHVLQSFHVETPTKVIDSQRQTKVLAVHLSQQEMILFPRRILIDIPPPAIQTVQHSDRRSQLVLDASLAPVWRLRPTL